MLGWQWLFGGSSVVKLLCKGFMCRDAKKLCGGEEPGLTASESAVMRCASS